MTEKQKGILIILILVPFLTIDILDYFIIPNKIKDEVKIPVTIPKGATLSQIADTLHKYKIIENKDMFTYWSVFTGKENKLRAGRYRLPGHLTYPQLLSYLTSTKETPLYITLIEGSSNNEIARSLAHTLPIDTARFDSLCHDPAFIEELLDERRPTLTGYLLPETYAFAWGIDEKDIIRHLVGETLQIFKADSVRKAMKSVQLDRHEVITLASIIEGEAMIDSERTTISSVYHNRLKRGMRLQADPTIQFILPGPPRRLLYKDLAIDSPYNTYRYSGLPPGPINNPGKASILAALFPEDTDYYFFVARGDGGHVFSRTAREHSRAKAEFNKIRREVRKKRKE